MSLVINVAAPLSGSVGDYVFQVVATSEDDTTTSTTSDFTATVTEKGTSGGPTTEELDEEEGGLPGFGALSAIAAIGAVLLIRRRL
jgi:PGF-CTERM protein